MRNFTGEYLHVIENVGCRCKICKGSIFKSQKRQDADAIYMTDRLKSICKFEEKQVADTLIPKKIIYLFLLWYTTEHCFLIHLICDNVRRKNIGYEFL